jgi:hypothetical protein
MTVAASHVWNSLEAAKLAAAALTPIVVAGAGYWLNRRLKSLEGAQWAQQKIVERRIQAYDEIAPDLNRLYYYFAYIGSWKQSTPPDIVDLKRRVDERAYVSAALFDRDFLLVFTELMDLCFATFGMWSADARLRTLPDRRKQAMGDTWDPAWDECFAERAQAVAPKQVKVAYTSVMAYLAAAMGATEVDAHMLGTGRTPANYDVSQIRVLSEIPSD